MTRTEFIITIVLTLLVAIALVVAAAMLARPVPKDRRLVPIVIGRNVVLIPAKR